MPCDLEVYISQIIPFLPFLSFPKLLGVRLISHSNKKETRTVSHWNKFPPYIIPLLKIYLFLILRILYMSTIFTLLLYPFSLNSPCVPPLPLQFMTFLSLLLLHTEPLLISLILQLTYQETQLGENWFPFFQQPLVVCSFLSMGEEVEKFPPSVLACSLVSLSRYYLGNKIIEISCLEDYLTAGVLILWLI